MSKLCVATHRNLLESFQFKFQNDATQNVEMWKFFNAFKEFQIEEEYELFVFFQNIFFVRFERKKNIWKHYFCFFITSS